jgi:hypothetical protein
MNQSAPWEVGWWFQRLDAFKPQEPECRVVGSSPRTIRNRHRLRRRLPVVFPILRGLVETCLGKWVHAFVLRKDKLK